MLHRTSKENKRAIWQITQEVIPSAKLYRSNNLLISFRKEHFPETEIREVAEKVINDPQDFKKFCEVFVLKYNNLDEHDFRHVLGQVDKMNSDQIEILLNKVLMCKSDILQIIKRSKKGE